MNHAYTPPPRNPAQRSSSRLPVQSRIIAGKPARACERGKMDHMQNDIFNLDQQPLTKMTGQANHEQLPILLQSRDHSELLEGVTLNSSRSAQISRQTLHSQSRRFSCEISLWLVLSVTVSYSRQRHRTMPCSHPMISFDEYEHSLGQDAFSQDWMAISRGFSTEHITQSVSTCVRSGSLRRVLKWGI